MSIKQAVRLVIDSAFQARGGEVFITKMPVIKIKHLAEVMIKELAPQYGHHPEDVQVKIIGTKPGEKLFEELMTSEEIRRSIELERYFVVKPGFTSLYNKIQYEYPNAISNQVDRPYNSSNEKILSKEELTEFLYEHQLLEGESIPHFEPDKRYWGDKEID
jgi:FlaA1/EpsC-like NDP-sugar epimerase